MRQAVVRDDDSGPDGVDELVLLDQALAALDEIDERIECTRGQRHRGAAAQQLARELVAQGYEVVYGGGKVGMMGVLADAALGAGGRVIGVIPKALLEKEVAHAGLTELRVVGSMHERKAMMAELSVGFIALP